MPVITEEELGIAVDLKGCPNRCRHCYAGARGTGKLSAEDLRWAVRQFREFIDSKGNTTPIRRLTVASWWYEPDYADNYRELFELERELTDGTPNRHELLSIWRLARDPAYALWAKEVRLDTCQITFFGMEETTDWFIRRRGAFRDALAATERLLEVGMKPRWQLFLTKRGIPELQEFMALVARLRLRERVEALGAKFHLFAHAPSPEAEAAKIEDLRPEVEDMARVPAELIESSRQHFHNQGPLWHTEAELLSQIMSEDEAFPYGYEHLKRFLMLVKSNWDVYPNDGAYDEWWKIGNLRRHSVAEIVARYEANDSPGLRTIYSVSPRSLAKQYGDPQGRRIYSNRDDLLCRYIWRYCDERTRTSATD